MAEKAKTGIWYEEIIQDDLKWSFTVEDILHSGKSQYQTVHLVETGPFGKVLLLDGKLQSAEADEFVYHELLVHPAMLHHCNPTSVFIAGGGEGATAREVLKHKTVQRVVMVDIDEVVCSFCAKHLDANKSAFSDSRLELICTDAGAWLSATDAKFDVIIGDLADPVFGGPCYQLYTQEFYETVVRQRLNEGGIFVTQSGPAGVLSCNQVFGPINNTLRSVFPTVMPYAQHVTSFSDTWGWNMALSNPSQCTMSAELLEERIASQVEGDLKFLDGATWAAVSALNKSVRHQLVEETHIYTKDNPKFIHGQGMKTLV